MMEEKRVTSEEMLKEFIMKAKEDETLGSRLAECAEGNELEVAPKIIKLAEEYGYRFTEEDLVHYLNGNRELDLDELDMVSGGCDDGSTLSGMGKLIGQWQYGRCFAGNVAVAVPSGDKCIKDIKAGDEIVSLNADGSKRVGKVTEVIEPKERPVISVTFENGKKWITTDTQWFYCGGDDYACVMEDGGKKAVTVDGGCTGVACVEETGRTEMVYDFVVDGLNVFFANGIAAEGFSLS